MKTRKLVKRLLACSFAMVMAVSVLAGCGKKESGLTHVTLNEVAHSIFYAPQYVAIAGGYFEDGLC